MAISVLQLVVLAGLIVYMVFMFKRGWYWQTLIGIAVIGGLASCILGLRRLDTQEGNQWVGVVLLLIGLLTIIISALLIRKKLPKP